MDANSAAFAAMLFSMPVAFVVDPLAPPLVFGLCLRAHLVHDPVLLGPAFVGFASPEFILIAAVLYAGHALADKVPPIAHLMDIIGLAVKPIAVALIGFFVAAKIDAGSALHWITLAAVLAGGVPATAALQALRTKVRLAASVGTLGAALPVISGVENVAGLTLASLAFLRPELALALIVIIGLPLVWLAWKLTRAAARGAVRLYQVGKSAFARSSRAA
jgi:hypothetical protein